MRKGKKGKSARRKGSSSFWAGVLLAVLLAAVSAVAVVVFRMVAEAPTYDEATLCPTSGPTSSLAILLDLTDPVSATQSQSLHRILNERVDAAPVGTLISVGIVSEDASEWGAQFARCKPATGSDANFLYQNPGLIADQFQSGFVVPFQQALERMLAAEEQRSSPIVESLQRLIEDTLTMTRGRSPDRLIIVSDLIQNSDRVSFYSCQGWDHFRSNGTALTRNLDGAQIVLARISRPGPSSCVSAHLEEFWSRYLDAKGADAPFEIETLGDL